MEQAAPASSNNMLKALYEERMKRKQENQEDQEVRRFYFGGQVILIKEYTGMHLGSHVWEGSEKLSMFLQQKFVREAGNVIEEPNPEGRMEEGNDEEEEEEEEEAPVKKIEKESLHGKRVIELGAGCGLIGIVIKKLFPSAHVTLTDKKEMIPILKKNLELNGLHESPSIDVQELTWGEGLDLWKTNTYDYIVASDIVFDDRLFGPLIKTCVALSGLHTTLLLAYTKRHKDEKVFFEQISKYFESATLHRTRSKLKESKSDVVVFNMKRKRYSVLE